MNYLRRIVDSLARVPDTPERTALAFSVGVFLGFSPFLGLHTLLGIGAAFLFRLNRLATLIGVWVNVPWILVPYYSFATWLGIVLMGQPSGVRLPHLTISEIFSVAFWEWLADQWQLLVPAFIGSLVLAAILAFLAYPLARSLIRRYRSYTGNGSNGE